MVIQDGIRLVRFHTRALLPSFASQNPPPSVGRLSVTCAFVITRIAPTPPALVIRKRSALHGVKDLRTVEVKNQIFVMRK